MDQQKISAVYAEMQKWKMMAIVVAPGGEIVSAIGYDGTLKGLPRAEDLAALHPNAFIRYLGCGQVRSAQELEDIVKDLTSPPAA